MDNYFKIEFLKEVLEFLEIIDKKARNKIFYNIEKVQKTNDKELFKKLTDDIWEFRTLFNKKQYRLFAFWDKTDKKLTVVIATHGIVKKTQKTPKKDIDKAADLMKQYFKEKKLRS